MNESPEARIRRMEAILNRSTDAVEALERALDALSELRPELRELLAYYGSSDWFADRELDSDGHLPRKLARGVLTEDAVYDLITDLARLREETETALALPEE